MDGDKYGIDMSKGRSIKYKLSNKYGQNLVTLQPVFWVGTPPPNSEHNMGPRRLFKYIRERDR